MRKLEIGIKGRHGNFAIPAGKQQAFRDAISGR